MVTQVRAHPAGCCKSCAIVDFLLRNLKDCDPGRCIAVSIKESAHLMRQSRLY